MLREGAVRYWVRAIREQGDGSIVSYRADIEAATSGDAAVALGDKVRANDLDGVTATGPGPWAVVEPVAVEGRSDG